MNESELQTTSVTGRIERTIAEASLEYQRCQLAAQWADLKGDDLAAAVLRSVAEGQTGKIHALMLLLRSLSEEMVPEVTDILSGARQRADAALASDEALVEEARTDLSDDRHAALKGALAITGRTARRLSELSATRSQA